MKRVKWGLVVSALVVTGLLCLTGTPVEAKTWTIKFATGHPPQIPSGSVLQQLEKVIPERTNGRVKFKAYLMGSLYTDYKAPPQVASGALEMSFGGYNLAAVSKGWNTIAGLPFLVDSYEHYLRFTETEAFKKMNANLEAKGIKFIAQAGHPGFSNSFNSKRSVATLADYQGLKMRIPPIPGLVKMCQAFGAQNVTVDMAEVSTALQTGVVDGTFAPVMKLKGYSLIKNTPYATVCNASFIPQTFVASTKFWNKLSPDLQKILTEIFVEYGQKCNGGFRIMEKKLWSIYQKGSGTTVTVLAPAEKVKWQTMVRPIWAEVTAASDEAKMVMKALEATR